MGDDPERDATACFLLLMDLETEALGRLVELVARRERRIAGRRGRTDAVVAWCSGSDEDEDETLAALQRFMPTAWWRWTAEEWEQRPPPVEAV